MCHGEVAFEFLQNSSEGKTFRVRARRCRPSRALRRDSCASPRPARCRLDKCHCREGSPCRSEWLRPLPFILSHRTLQRPVNGLLDSDLLSNISSLIKTIDEAYIRPILTFYFSTRAPLATLGGPHTKDRSEVIQYRIRHLSQNDILFQSLKISTELLSAYSCSKDIKRAQLEH